jgi:hypothetical protein
VDTFLWSVVVATLIHGNHFISKYIIIIALVTIIYSMLIDVL